MKKTNFPFLIFGGVITLILSNLFGCTQTASSIGYPLGWKSDHAYILVVEGIWDRNSYHVDGERDEENDFGKIAVSSFELRRQAELFARTRAIFNFQEKMADYFNNLDENELASIVEEVKEVEEVEEVEEGEGLDDEEMNEEEANEPQPVDTSLVTTIEPAQVLIGSNEKPEVFYEDPNQTNLNIVQNQDIGAIPELEAVEPEPETASTPSSPSPQTKKTINFRQIFDKVDLKITLLERVYTINNDVNIVYLFSGKNLKQELARAFREFDVSNRAIELRK